MIKILPLRDNEMLASLNEKEKTAARLCYCMYDADQIGGYILYNLNAENGIIQAINSPDDMIADGLVRAVFASLYDFGINSAIFNQNIDNTLIARLNFVKLGEYNTSSIENIIYGCKKCKL
ncbi:MAG: hypothetical protein WAX04_11605 [Oscillospiraceae bacterium]